MTESREAIIPVEQVTIQFYNHPIIAVRLPDGRIAAVLNDICNAIQLEK